MKPGALLAVLLVTALGVGVAVALLGIAHSREAEALAARALESERVAREAAVLDDAELREPSAAPIGLDEVLARLDALERRLATLEREADPERAAAENPSLELHPDTAEGLRLLVLDWVAAERAAREETESIAAERAAHDERAFEARYRAFTLARQHDLADWEREKLERIFLETATRAAQVEASIDVSEDDPREVEERWEEFDAWVERFEREEMGAELYAKLAEDG